MSVVDPVSVCCVQRSLLNLPLNLTRTTPIPMLVSETHAGKGRGGAYRND